MKSFRDWSVSSFIRADRWIASEQMPGHAFAAANNAARLVARLDQLSISDERKFLVAANALARMQTPRGVETLAGYAENLLAESGSKAKLARRGLYFLSVFAPEDGLSPAQSRFAKGLEARLTRVVPLVAKSTRPALVSSGESPSVLAAS